MYSEALKILDENTIKYMIDELQKELAEKDATLKMKDQEIQELKKCCKFIIPHAIPPNSKI